MLSDNKRSILHHNFYVSMTNRNSSRAILNDCDWIFAQNFSPKGVSSCAFSSLFNKWICSKKGAHHRVRPSSKLKVVKTQLTVGTGWLTDSSMTDSSQTVWERWSSLSYLSHSLNPISLFSLHSLSLSIFVGHRGLVRFSLTLAS